MADKKWDGFSDEVISQRTRKVECHVCTMLREHLTKDAQEIVEAALRRREISSSSIRKALQAREVALVPSIWSLNRHRRNECRDTRS